MTSFIRVAPPAEQCPAKTWIDESGINRLGRSVADHCLIVGTIAKELQKLFPETISSIFPSGSALIAACHDVGKISPTFFLRLELMAGISDGTVKELLQETSFTDNPEAIRQYESERWGGHPGVSFVTMMELTHDHNIATVVGQHHGSLPKKDLQWQRADDEDFGGPLWEKSREKFINECENELKESFPASMTTVQRQLVSGLTTAADWIGSGSIFDNPESPWQPLISQATADAGMSPVSIKGSLTFGEIFKDNDGTPYSPNKFQEALGKVASEPGVYILEAPMGLGKTEAALFAAYLALSSGHARGIYFALPTQLTANKIYERFANFLSAAAPDSDLPGLLHANAEDFFEHLDMGGGEFTPGNSWFSAKKRGLLAPFAVGTVDQALLSVMAVRHSFVRLFGLAGKVVVIDEVHSYDAYTGFLLKELINELAALKCTVILLSATLTRSSRHQLLFPEKAKSSRGRRELSEDERQDFGYPVISYRKNGTVGHISFPPQPDSTVFVSLHHEEQGERDAIEEALKRAENHQQVLWIENDVATSQRIYRLLAARAKEIGVDCGLLHSRFTRGDRQNIESAWVPRLGKSGWAHRLDCGRILVGTQILEQSLDIDADFMVSRIAPIDLIFQRSGRLWRHQKTPRSDAAVREMWILSPTLQEALENPRQNLGFSAAVYSPYTLCRTLETLEPVSELAVPSDIPRLMEAALGDRPETGLFGNLKNDLLYGTPKCPGIYRLIEDARKNLNNPCTSTEDDSTAQTRHSEIPTVDMLLIQNIATENGRTVLTLLNGEKVTFPHEQKDFSKSQWKKIASSLRSSFIHLSVTRAKGFSISFEKAKAFGFGNFIYLGSPNSENLFIALIDQSGTAFNLSRDCTQYYDSTIGWCLEKE